MFSFVKFKADNLSHICLSKKVTQKNNDFYAPYYGIKYKCNVLCKNDSKSLLEIFQRNLETESPQILIKKLKNMQIISAENVDEKKFNYQERNSNYDSTSDDDTRPITLFNNIDEESKTDKSTDLENPEIQEKCALEPELLESDSSQKTCNSPIDCRDSTFSESEKLSDTDVNVKTINLSCSQKLTDCGNENEELQDKSTDLENPEIQEKCALEPELLESDSSQKTCNSPIDCCDSTFSESEKLSDTDVNVKAINLSCSQKLTDCGNENEELQDESDDLGDPIITYRSVLMEELQEDLMSPVSSQKIKSSLINSGNNNSFKSENLRDSDVTLQNPNLSGFQMIDYEDENVSLNEQPADDSADLVNQSGLRIKSVVILDDANKINLQHYQQIQNGSNDNIGLKRVEVFDEKGQLLDDVELQVDPECFSVNLGEYYANDTMNIEDSFNVIESNFNQVEKQIIIEPENPSDNEFNGIDNVDNDPDYVPEKEEEIFLENENLSTSNFDDIDNFNNNLDYVPEKRVSTDSHQIKLVSNNKIADPKKKNIKNLKITTGLVNKDAPLLKLDLEANKDKVLGEALSKPAECIVESSANGSKIYNCPFCPKQLKGKLSDHLKNVHKSHPDVIALKSLPKIKRLKGQPLSPKEKEKNRLYADLRKKGAFKYNYTANKTDKIQTVRRTQKNVLPKMLNEYRICPFCFGAYGKESIRKHLDKCGGISSSTGKCVKPYHNLVIGDVHSEANMFLRVVIARLNDDEEANVAKHDLLIVTYANYQAIKFKTSSHHNKQIRAEMRLLARILLSMRSKNSNISDLVSMLDPEYSKLYFQTANELGKFNPSRGIFEAPATARDVGRLIKNVCELWITECIERKLPEENRKSVEDFLFVHNKKFPPLISRTVAESQTNLDIEKGIQHLPDTSDIKKLKLYVTNIREEAYRKLNNDYDYPTWLALLKSTLISILILNRRRPGELSRLHLTYYNNFAETISQSINPEFYKNMSKTSKAIASNYVRILCRGKQNYKVVPILLNKDMKESIDLILKFRNEAKVPKDNPYIIGLPFISINSTEFRFAEACPILADYAMKCGAAIPHLLRTVQLRKHIATASVALDLTEMQVENLSKFLGHEKDIHLKVYRQRAAAKDILEVSQWLEFAQGEFAETPDGNMIRIEEECLSDMEEGGENNKENINNDNKQPQNQKEISLPISKSSNNIPKKSTFSDVPLGSKKNGIVSVQV